MTEQLPEADLLNAAERIAQEIVGAAIWHGKRCNWVGAMPEEGPRGRTTLSFRALGADPYGGSAGVGLFLAELARATGDTDCRRTALGALRHAISHVDDLLPGSELGLYAGRPGVAVTLALASQALNEPELEAAARAVAAAISPGQGADGHDLMAGHAGAVVGLLTLRVLLSDDTLLEAAVGHGEALLAGAERTDGNLCWRTRSLPAAPGLTGLSHGAAGVAVALLELAAAADATQYRDAADAAFAYERALYDRAARNWPDLRGIARGEAAVGPSFATFWCHGAPGGALARLRALELGASDELFTEARAALETTEAWVTAALESGSVNYC